MEKEKNIKDSSLKDILVEGSSTNLKKISELVDKALLSGKMSELEHEQLMKEVHKDGKIDSLESAELSRLFAAVQSGKIQIIENIDKPNINKNNYPEFNSASNGFSSKVSTTEEKDSQSTFFSESSFDNTIDKNLDPLSISESDLTNQFSQGSEFRLAQERMLEIDLKHRVWMKIGTMIAYEGSISFRREGIAEHGITKLLKRGLTGETVPLTAAEGVGKLFLADQGRSINVWDISKDSLVVQSTNLLAFQDSISWDIKPLFNISTAMAGGLFHVYLSGSGLAAITTRFEPMVLEVTPGKTLFTDARATIAWSSGVNPNFRADISLQTLIGRTSGETIQLRFSGKGFVIVQPYEESHDNL